jgi:hypothetical protein
MARRIGDRGKQKRRTNGPPFLISLCVVLGERLCLALSQREGVYG